MLRRQGCPARTRHAGERRQSPSTGPPVARARDAARGVVSHLALVASATLRLGHERQLGEVTVVRPGRQVADKPRGDVYRIDGSGGQHVLQLRLRKAAIAIVPKPTSPHGLPRGALDAGAPRSGRANAGF